jgi:hypothetical protein
MNKFLLFFPLQLFQLILILHFFQDLVAEELIKSGSFSIKEHYQTELTKIRSEMEQIQVQGSEPSKPLVPEVARPQRKF